MKEVVAAVVVVASLWASSSVWARKAVYSPWVQAGETEVSYYVDGYQDSAGKAVNGQELELEYGLGPRDGVALYLVDGHRAGDVVEAAWKLEWIHTLSRPGARQGVGLYLEYQQKRAAVDQVEFKPLYELQAERLPLRLRINGEFEAEVGGGAESGVEIGYAASLARTDLDRITPAIELFGTLGELDRVKAVGEQSHLLGPVVEIELMPALEWQLGALFGLTSGSEPWRLKSQLSLEWE